MVKRPAHQEIISPVKSDSDEPTDYGVTSESSQVPQEGRDISYEVSEEALLKEFAELIEAEELSPYKEHEERIRPGFIERIPAIVDFLKKQRDAVETAQAALSKAARKRKRTLYIYAILGSIVVAGLVSGFFLGYRLDYAVPLILILLGLGVFPSGLSAESITPTKARSNLLSQINSLRSARRVKVSEALRETINDVLGKEGISSVPTIAPALVELTSSNIMPSATQRYVKEFITTQQSSAIGVAGPRGAGKSTLMRAIAEDRTVTYHSVFMSAPVKYEPVDFVRRLFFEVAMKVLGKEGREATAFRAPRRVERTRLGAAVVAILAGGLLITYDLVLANRVSVRTLTGLGLVFLMYGVGVFIYARLNAFRRARLRNKTSPAMQRAAEAVERLQWDFERGEKSKNLLKLADGLFGAEDEDSITMKRRSFSHPDLVADFRDMLEEFSNENLKAEQQSRFVIFIDELDKLSSRDELIEAINGLKDLFHISGVHFVVSVSTDALASFEQRGLAARDAFDSAFDTIVEVKRLTVKESLDVISRRVTGFPTVLSVFCHAWSGGLPRDLLRTARRCVEVQRNSKHALATTAIMKAVVISELIGQVDAKLRIWNETGSGGTQALLAIRKTLNDFEKGSETPTSVIAGLSQSSIQKDAVDRVSDQVQMGMALLECLSDISQAQFHGELPEDSILANVSALARAVSMEGEPRELRNEAVGEVIRKVVVLA